MPKFDLSRIGIALLLTSFQPTASFANWVSSGGEIFQPEHNPWFVRNTAIVNYCVAVDTSSVSASVADVESRVKDAIDYWHTELSKPLLDPPLGNQILRKIDIGTQTFVKTDCADPTVDVRVVVGAGALLQPEHDYLANLSPFVGVAVRTDYDEVNLRAKGFIYIASDFGPSRYSPGNTDVIDRAWQSPRLMTLALIHELGHVFGFAHKGAGVMSEIFLEQLISAGFGTLVENGPMPSVLMPNLELENCGLSPLQLQYLGQDPLQGIKCVSLSFSTALPGILGTGAEIPVYGTKSLPTPGAPAPAKFQIGSLKHTVLNQLDLQMDPAVFLYVNPKQTVFTADEIGHAPFFVGPIFEEFGGEAVFAPLDPAAQARPAYFNVGPESFRVFGQQTNRMLPIFEWHSLSGLALVIHR